MPQPLTNPWKYRQICMKSKIIIQITCCVLFVICFGNFTVHQSRVLISSQVGSDHTAKSKHFDPFLCLQIAKEKKKILKNQCWVRAEAWLGLVLARAFGKKSSAQLSSPCLPKSSARLGSPYLAKKARFSSACSIIEKTELP